MSSKDNSIQQMRELLKAENYREFDFVTFKAVWEAFEPKLLMALDFWNLFHTPRKFRIEDYEPVYCDHEEKAYLSDLTEDLELFQCRGCAHLFTKEGGEFREPEPKDWEA